MSKNILNITIEEKDNILNFFNIFVPLSNATIPMPLEEYSKPLVDLGINPRNPQNHTFLGHTFTNLNDEEITIGNAYEVKHYDKSLHKEDILIFNHKKNTIEKTNPKDFEARNIQYKSTHHLDKSYLKLEK